ncbi:VOC family protein [Frigidibacter sp. MR17.14]|uniref:VOC family protein n=1 Tax=Frigidibacter sp. MR17.14 TaxID=3126509 RepID=UPI003012F6AD
MIEGLHHVQLAMPPGGEEAARGFYAGVLGLTEIGKPPRLAARGGVWFRGPGTEVHLGVEAAFAPARKAHPAFRVTALGRMTAHLAACGIAFHPDVDLPGLRRVFVDDPFGNRIELLELTGDPG